VNSNRKWAILESAVHLASILLSNVVVISELDLTSVGVVLTGLLLCSVRVGVLRFHEILNSISVSTTSVASLATVVTISGRAVDKLLLR